MKYLPNIITLSRILLSAFILFLPPFSAVFFIIYIICGLSDMLDGFFAKRFNLSSRIGALLDSIADIFFVISAAFSIFSVISLPLFCIISIILIALLRIFTAILGYIKFKAFSFFHTYANKVTGFSLFLFPFFLSVTEIYISCIIICSIAFFASVEEIFIVIKSKSFDPDIKCIFTKK